MVSLDWIAKKCIDQVRNRVFGNSYRGFSPKSPRKLNIPLFSVVDTGIESKARLVNEKLRALHPLLQFKKPLVVAVGECGLVRQEGQGIDSRHMKGDVVSVLV